jgi:UDP-glucose 4-epimerase
MKYLVTGCAGFVGSHIVDALLARGHEVIGVDNLSTGINRFMADATLSERFTFIEGDLLLEPTLLDGLKEIDCVYHFAANADIRGGMADSKKDLEQNVIVTYFLLEFMKANGVKRIIFASSAAALGEPSQFPTPENCAIPNQTSLYGASKMACEGLISAYSEGFGIESYVFRFVSLLGPRYPHGHVYDFIKQLIANPKKLNVLGDGTAKKSYLHISDCVDALMLICENLRPALIGSHFQVFHLGCPEYCQVRQSALWITEAIGLNPRIEFGQGSKGWVGDNPFVFLDVSKALTLGWAPKFTIKDSISETAQWLWKNQWMFDCRK